MVKVEMPRASWEEVIWCLEELADQGYILNALREEIADQVYSQEY